LIHKNTIPLEPCSFEHFQTLCGQQDENLKLLKQVFNVDFVIRDNVLIIDSLDETIVDQVCIGRSTR
jgi:phosphate starvation-inducible protein PhoH